MKDYLQKAYAMNGTFRVYAAITTDIVKHAEKIFNMWPTSCAALGRTLTMGAIMSSTYDPRDYINIRIDGDGPIGKIRVDAHDGKVRGFCENPGIYLSYNNGHLDVKDAVGNGTLEVVKDIHMRQPFSGSVELISGEIAEDFAYYYAKSEQIPTAVGLGVLFDTESKVKAAGGFLVQKMPGAKDSDITIIEENLKKLKPCSTMIEEGYSAEDIIKEITKNGDYQILETKELSYECNCSKERFKNGIASIGYDEILNIAKEDKKAEITCNFCNTKYTFDEKELLDIADEVKKRKENK